MDKSIYPKPYSMYGTGGAFTFYPGTNGIVVSAAPRLPGVTTKGPIEAGTRVYDWSGSKEVMSLDINDILKISYLARHILATKKPIGKTDASMIYHEYKGVVKQLVISDIYDSNNNHRGYTIAFKIKDQSGNNKIVANHSLQKHELYFMAEVLPIWVYKLLNWDNYVPSNINNDTGGHTANEIDTYLPEEKQPQEEILGDFEGEDNDFGW